MIWKKKLIGKINETLPPAFLVTFSFFIFGMLEMYLTNINEFWFGFGDVLKIALPLFLISLIVLTFVGAVLSEKAGGYYNAVVFGIGLALYVQGNWLNNDYGLLNGRNIDWSQYAVRGVVSIAVWGICIAAPVVLTAFKREWLKKVIVFLSLTTIAVQIVTLGITLFFDNSNILGQPSASTQGNAVLSEDGMFELSSNENVIVFLLDAFDASYSEQLLENYPEYQNLLQGFTFYDNVISAYNVTACAVPQILSGHPFFYETSYEDYIKSTYNDSALFNALSKQNYSVGIYEDSKLIPQRYDIIDNQFYSESEISSYGHFSVLFSKLTAYRFLPQFVKGYMWIYSGEFASVQTVKDTGKSNNSIYHVDDVNFHKKLDEAKLTVAGDQKVFRYYHLFGAHAPYTLDKNGWSFEDTNQQLTIHGVFAIVDDYLSQLKNLGLYDKSTIIIMSDHGYEGLFSNPTLMIKDKDKCSGFFINSKPYSYLKNLEDSFLELLDGEKHIDSVFHYSAETGEQRYFYDFMNNNLTEYITIGKASDFSNYSRTGNVYSLESLGIDSPKDGYEYTLGTELSADQLESISQYGFKGGYSYGYDSSLCLKLVDYKNTDLRCSLKLEETRLFPCTVSLYVNDKYVGESCIDSYAGTMSFIIPASCVSEDKNIQLVFRYSLASEIVAAGYRADDVYSYKWNSILLEASEKNDGAISDRDDGESLKIEKVLCKNCDNGIDGTVLHVGGIMYGAYLSMPAGTYKISIHGKDLDHASFYVVGEQKNKSVNPELTTEESSNTCRSYLFQLDHISRSTDFVVYNNSSENFTVDHMVLEKIPDW